jgi:hypothetical protein
MDELPFSFAGLMKLSSQQHWWRQNPAVKNSNLQPVMAKRYEGDYRWFICDLGKWWTEILRHKLDKPLGCPKNIDLILETVKPRPVKGPRKSMAMTETPPVAQRQKEKVNVADADAEKIAIFLSITERKKCTVKDLQQVFQECRIETCKLKRKADLLNHFMEYSSTIEYAIKNNKKATGTRAKRNSRLRK